VTTADARAGSAAVGADDALSIFAAARDAGDALALHVGDQRLRFADLARLTEQRLGALALETRAGRPHPLVGSNTLDTLVTLYALLELRVPALLLHPKLTAVEIAAEQAQAAQAAGALPADAAAVLYTSGTTGRARGAVLTRSALLASAEASSANLGWQDDDCWLLVMPVARVGGLSIVTRCLAARRALALAPAFDAALLPRWIAEHRIKAVSLGEEGVLCVDTSDVCRHMNRRVHLEVRKIGQEHMAIPAAPAISSDLPETTIAPSSTLGEGGTTRESLPPTWSEPTLIPELAKGK